MLYFSELDNIPVYTIEGTRVGYLDDLIFSFDKTPSIRKLLIATGNLRALQIKKLLDLDNKVIISYNDVERLTESKVIIKKTYKQTTIEENELYVRKNLLDTQVIDIEDNNIVRVNDVLIQKSQTHNFIIYGVDIGFAGVLRWLHIEKPIDKIFRLFHKTIPQETLAWSDIQPLELTRGRVVVKSHFSSVRKLHPADLADYLETQNFRNVATLIEGFDKNYLADVISELNPVFQRSLLKRMPISKVGYLISLLDPDEAVDVISIFSRKKQEEVLKYLPKDEGKTVRHLMTLSSTALGQYLNSDFLVVSPQDTVAEVLKKIKEESISFSNLDYVYVANSNHQLIGVFNLHELFLQGADVSVFRFMIQRLATANLTTSVEVAFRRMVRYKITTLPVIDRSRKMIGIVTFDDIAEEILKQFPQ